MHVWVRKACVAHAVYHRHAARRPGRLARLPSDTRPGGNDLAPCVSTIFLTPEWQLALFQLTNKAIANARIRVLADNGSPIIPGTKQTQHHFLIDPQPANSGLGQTLREGEPGV